MAQAKFPAGLDLVNQLISNLGSPSASTDAANKAYVDNRVDGLSYKDEVRVATTANGTLATAYENGDTVDGITLATGDRILLKNQTTQTENGIYTVNASGTPTRATDADSTAELNNATVYVKVGTANAGFEFTQITANPTVGSSNIVWTQKTAGASYTASLGVQLVSSDFRADLDASGGLELNSNSVRVKLADATLTRAAGGMSVTSPKLKYAADIGDNSSTSLTVTHSLGTKDVTVEVFDNTTPYAKIYPDIQHTSTSAITVVFGTAPTTGQYRCVVVG